MKADLKNKKLIIKEKVTACIMAAVLSLSLGGLNSPAMALDLGIEGQVFEPIEEDFRLAMLRMMAMHDWAVNIDELETSAKEYTKNLPQFGMEVVEKTATRWHDVGIITSEDIYLPWIDWETGSVFEPEKKLAVKAGTYLNPIAHLPSAAIDRLFIFDARVPEQLESAKALMQKNIPLLNFMITAGDLGPIAKEMGQPVFHLTPDIKERFEITRVPVLIGFGRGQHLGHAAVTELKTPVQEADIKNAWYGLPYEGYDPEYIPEMEGSVEKLAETRQAFEKAANLARQQKSPPQTP